jgi:anti-sigma factor RsiW
LNPQDVCPDWLEEISAYLDGELAAAEEHRVHAHLRRCQACADHLVDLVPVVQALRALPPIVPAHDPWLAIARELRQEPLFYRRRALLRLHRLPRPILGAAAAAAAAVVVSISYAGYQQATPPPVADLDMYYHQHDLYTHQDGVPSLYAPEFNAVKASYQLDE